MSWIEGVGDEVTITFTIFLGLIVLLLAWYSTGIRDIPFISVIIVQFTRRRVRTPNVEQTPTSAQVLEESQNEAQANSNSGDVTIEESSQASASETTETGENKDSKAKTKNEDDNKTSTVNQLEENSHNSSCYEEIKATTVHPNESGLPKQETDLAKLVNTNGNDNSVNVQDEDDTICDTEVTSLSEQEIRQKRLEFFISGSQNIVDNQRIETQVEENENESIENVTSQERDSTPPVQNVASCDSKPETGSSVDSSVDSRTSQSENQSSSDGQSTENEIRVRIKFLNDEQRSITCSPTETIGSFRRRHFSAELSESKLVRFIFNGQDLRNDASTLQSYNIMDNSVLHCLVTQPRQSEQPRVHEDDGLDMGTFMFPLFGVLLGIVWYMRFMYRQFFNVTSTLTLGGITFLYLAAFLSSLRGHRHEHLD